MFNVTFNFQHIVAIGTSTGGPKALMEVISSLPESFPAPILIVQHMSPKFTHSLAKRLDDHSEVKVVEAEHDQRVEAGVAYIAPGGWHMKIGRFHEANYRITLTQEERVAGHRPSVDKLFESLLPLHELKRHIVIMTGMGSDGAQRMKQLRLSGACTTIAEAEETSVVYGMPKAALELGAAQHVLPLQYIAQKLTESVN